MNDRQQWKLRRGLACLVLLLTFAVTCNEVSAQDRSYRGRTMDEWIEALNSRSSERDRETASRVIKSLGPAAVPGLNDVLTTAKRSFLYFETRKVVGQLYEPLLPMLVADFPPRNSMEFRNRVRLLRLALSYYDKDLSSECLDLLDKISNPRTRGLIISRLYNSGHSSERFIKILIDASSSDHRYLQMKTAMAFGTQGELAKNDGVAMALNRLLMSDDEFTRIEALSSVVRLQLMNPKLEQGLHNSFRMLSRDMIANNLSDLKKAVALYPSIEKLLMSLTVSGDRTLRNCSITLLGSCRGVNPKRIEILKKCLDSKWNEGRYAALLALIDMGKDAKPCLPKLLSLLDKEAKVAPPLELYEILQNLGYSGSAAIPIMMKFTRLKDRRHVKLSLLTLGHIGRKDPKVLGFFLGHLRAQTPAQNYGALLGLAELGVRSEKVFAALGSFLQNNNHFNNQLLAVSVLLRLKPPEAFWQKYIHFSKSKDDEIRSLPYECLARVGPGASGFCPELIKRFDLETNDWVRSRILNALVMLNPKGQELLKILMDICGAKLQPKRSWTRAAAFAGLRHLKTLDRRTFIPVLIQLWKTAPNTREDVYKTLETIKDPEGQARSFLVSRIILGDEEALATLAKMQGWKISALLTTLFQEKDSALKNKVIEEMKGFARESARVRTCLLQGLADSNWKIRLESIRSLDGAVTLSGSDISIIEKRLTDENWHVRRGAVNLLGSLRRRGRSSIPKLLSALKDESQIIRADAAMAIARILPESNAVEAHLLPLLDDWDVRVRCAVLYALGRVKSSSRTSLEAQLRALDDVSYAVRRWALYSLSQCQTAQLSELNELLEKDFDQKYPEFGILSHDIGPRFIPVLVKRLASKNSDVRYYATYFLSQLGEAATPALFQSLKDSDAIIRQMAAKGLARIGEKAGPALIQLLAQHKSPSDQVLTLSILSKLKTCPNEALPHLLEALKSKDAQLRSLAIETLVQVEKPGEEVFAALTPLLRDPHWSVRSRAKDAVAQLRRRVKKQSIEKK